MTILLATANPHKKEELERILRPHDIQIPQDWNNDVEESGNSYLENALLKAYALFEDSKGQPVIADDSGLSLPALNGEPGIHSARYGSEKMGRLLSSEERNSLLLENTAHLSGEERRAFFVCCMVLIWDEYRIFTVQETCSGYLAAAPRGTGGFGYDPIFFLPEPGCCVAEISAGDKDAISHRGRAGRRMKNILDSINLYP